MIFRRTGCLRAILCVVGQTDDGHTRTAIHHPGKSRQSAVNLRETIFKEGPGPYCRPSCLNLTSPQSSTAVDGLVAETPDLIGGQKVVNVPAFPNIRPRKGFHFHSVGTCTKKKEKSLSKSAAETPDLMRGQKLAKVPVYLNIRPSGFNSTLYVLVYNRDILREMPLEISR